MANCHFPAAFSHNTESRLEAIEYSLCVRKKMWHLERLIALSIVGSKKKCKKDKLRTIDELKRAHYDVSLYVNDDQSELLRDLKENGDGFAHHISITEAEFGQAIADEDDDEEERNNKRHLVALLYRLHRELGVPFTKDPLQ